MMLMRDFEKTWSEWQMQGVGNASVMSVSKVDLGSRKMKVTTLGH